MGKINTIELIRAILSRNNEREHIIRQIGTLGNDNKNYYYYIPAPEHYFEVIIDDILKDNNYYKKTFIDIGCGNTKIMDIMSILGMKSYGLEYSKLYTDLIPELLLGDLIQYNFKDYDILYSYNPIKNNDLMIDGLKNIINTMKKNSVFYFIPASSVIIDFCEKNNFVAIGNKWNQCYKYIKK